MSFWVDLFGFRLIFVLVCLLLVLGGLPVWLCLFCGWSIDCLVARWWLGLDLVIAWLVLLICCY